MTRRLPPLKALRAFEVAGRHSSFSKAAEELSLTPGAVYRQVVLLEDYFQIKLFDRLHREIRLTAESRAFLAEITDALDRIADASGRLSERSRKTPLHIATTLTFATCWLTPRFRRMIEAIGESECRLSSELVLKPNAFTIHDVDVLIHSGHDRWPEFENHMLMQSRFVPVCSPDYLERNGPFRNPSDLSRCMFLRSSIMLDVWTNWERSNGLTGQHRGGYQDFACSILAYQAASAGLGVTLGHVDFIGAELKAGRLVKAVDEIHETDYFYYFACRPGATANPVIAALRDWIMAETKRGNPD